MTKFWRTILIDGIVKMGSTFFLIITLLAFLHDLYNYLNCSTSGYETGCWTFEWTFTLIRQIPFFILPLSLFVGLCMGLILWNYRPNVK